MTHALRRGQLRVIDGDAYPDWESVYADNLAGMYRFVFASVGNRPDAEDLTEEVFLAALPRLRLPAPRHEVRAYLVATGRTVLADHWRKRYGAPTPASFDVETADVRPVDWEEGLEARARAWRLLSRLPERYRQVLELRFLQGLSVREVAAELGASEGNVRVLQHRAIRQAALLEEEVWR
jgi:RNA polymerase sigma factor (sigma-70 family)